MAAGAVQYELMCQKCSFAPWVEVNEESAKEIKRLKAKRKKIIRLGIDAQKEHECIMSLASDKMKNALLLAFTQKENRTK